MADHAYAANYSKHATTDAGGVDTVTFSGGKVGFRIQNHSASPIYYSWAALTPVTPATDGSVDGSYYLAPGAADARTSVNNTLVVKVTSVAPAAYSVETWTAPDISGLAGSVDGSLILAALAPVDGAGSGLDADKVDGAQLASLVQTTGNQTVAGVKTFSDVIYGLAFAGGTNPALAGTWRIPNNSAIWARNAANTNDLRLFYATTSDHTRVNGSLTHNVLLAIDDVDIVTVSPTAVTSTMPFVHGGAQYTGAARGRTLGFVTGPDGNAMPIGRPPWANTWTIIQTNAASIRQDGHGTSAMTGPGSPSFTAIQGSATRPPGVRMATQGTSTNQNVHLDVGTIVWLRGTAGDMYGGFEAHLRGWWANDASYNNTGASTGSRLFPLCFYNSATSLTTVLGADRGSTTDLAAFVRAHVNGGATDTNFQFVTCDNTTTNTVDTGMAFTVSHVYSFDIWCPLGGTSIAWRVEDRTAGTTQSGTVSSNLPRATTGLALTSATMSVDATQRSTDWNALSVAADVG